MALAGPGAVERAFFGVTDNIGKGVKHIGSGVWYVWEKGKIVIAPVVIVGVMAIALAHFASDKSDVQRGIQNFDDRIGDVGEIPGHLIGRIIDGFTDWVHLPDFNGTPGIDNGTGKPTDYYGNGGSTGSTGGSTGGSSDGSTGSTGELDLSCTNGLRTDHKPEQGPWVLDASNGTSFVANVWDPTRRYEAGKEVATVIDGQKVVLDAAGSAWQYAPGCEQATQDQLVSNPLPHVSLSDLETAGLVR